MLKFPWQWTSYPLADCLSTLSPGTVHVQLPILLLTKFLPQFLLLFRPSFSFITPCSWPPCLTLTLFWSFRWVGSVYSITSFLFPGLMSPGSHYVSFMLGISKAVWSEHFLNLSQTLCEQFHLLLSFCLSAAPVSNLLNPWKQLFGEPRRLNNHS